MSGRGPPRRDVNGILLLDKPRGATSNRVLQRAKRLFNAAKAGHTGSLDPMATGMLPVCFGAATKVCGQLLGSRKSYRVVACLGASTDTGDADGRVVETRAVRSVESEEIESVLHGFEGDSLQVPPMYSALKHRGRRLHELARRGEEVPRPPRRVTIYEITLEALEWPRFRFHVRCSKGTYIRSLVSDIAERLDTVGHVAALRRLQVEPYAEAQMMSLATLETAAHSGFEALDATLLGIDTALIGLPSVSLDDDRSQRLRRGQRVSLDSGLDVPAGEVRVYGPEETFLGIGNVDAGGELKPRRLFPA